MVFALSAPGSRVSAEQPRRVLLLGSFGREFAPYNTLIGSFKTEMARRSSEPIEFHEVSLEMARFSDSEEEAPFVDYIRALFAYRRLDLVVPTGGAAVRFWQRHRDELFPSAPVLITGVEERHLQDAQPVRTAAVAVRLDLPGAIEDILHLMPGTTSIAVVLGDSPLERFWAEETRREWQRFDGRVQFFWWNELSFDQMRQRAATLAPGSCILYVMMSVDAHGIPYEDERALSILNAEANAPIFGLFTTQLGRGIVGGRLVDVNELARTTVRAALQILAGEQPGNIQIAPIEPGSPVYDWRELRRWGIREASLPLASTILHRAPSPWERYGWRIVLGLGIIGAQGLALAGLLVQRAQRRRSERVNRELRRELLHAARVSTVGELSASLAHELHQPLGAILRNAEAAELLLRGSPPDLDELQCILADIRQDDERAASVIDRLRELLERHDLESRALVVGELFDEVRSLLGAEAASRGLRLELDSPADLPRVKGDRVHLIQVLLNLVVNAMDACNGADDAGKSVRVRAHHGNAFVEIAVSDTGQGIPTQDLERVFEPFHTTKPNGLGLGLSISRTIIEAHGGRVWASNGRQRGATIHFTLPIETQGVYA